MRQTSLLILFIVCFTGPSASAQQADEPSKIEVGVHFSSLVGRELQPQFSLDRIKSEAGIGARFSFNLNRHVALEAEANFFPRPEIDFGFDSDNLIVQGQFGVKAGKRFDRFGIFAKARPGFLSFPEVLTQTGTTTIVVNDRPEVFPILEARRRNFFSLDLGGVLEFYPTHRILVRFDAGDTMVHTGDARTVSFSLNVPPPSFARTAHNFQFSSGIAFRFLNPEPVQDSDGFSSRSERKFEAGMQFSSMRLKVFAETQLPALPFEGQDIQSGFGGRLTYNSTSSIAAEIQADYFPAELFTFANGRAGGHMFQVQAGPKIGKRFERFGVFGKVRPGVVSFSETIKWDRFDSNLAFTSFHIERRNYFSLDLGGVLEFYPTPRIVTRFDGGDTMIHYGTTDVPFHSLSMPVIQTPSRTRHQFQFSAGVGFRF